jgi:hypothetical protein
MKVATPGVCNFAKDRYTFRIEITEMIKLHRALGEQAKQRSYRITRMTAAVDETRKLIRQPGIGRRVEGFFVLD